MKVALVKQMLDVFGPWSGVKWKDTSPEKLFEIWPSKAVYWELTCMLQCDWYIVPEGSNSEYIREAVWKHPGRAETIRKYTSNVTAVPDIPFENYDLVITFDAILQPPTGAGTLFAFYAQEHWDELYRRSLVRLPRGYDLFLAHMMDASSEIRSLPQAISFPYLHSASFVRSTFSAEKQERVWVDWRTLTTLAMMSLGDAWREEADAAAERLRGVLSLPVEYRGKHHQQTFGFSDPPRWADAATYFQAMAQCQYYVGVGNIAGAGQGLGDAASAGCLCIGQADKAYHQLICHPLCLCEDIAEMPSRLRKLRESSDLQREVATWQDEKLTKHFNVGPLDLLAQAMQMKRKALSARVPS